MQKSNDYFTTTNMLEVDSMSKNNTGKHRSKTVRLQRKF